MTVASCQTADPSSRTLPQTPAALTRAVNACPNPCAGYARTRVTLRLTHHSQADHTLSVRYDRSTLVQDLTSAAVGTQIAVPSAQGIEVAFETNDAIDGLQADPCALQTPHRFRRMRGGSPCVRQLSLCTPVQVP